MGMVKDLVKNRVLELKAEKKYLDRRIRLLNENGAPVVRVERELKSIKEAISLSQTLIDSSLESPSNAN